MNMLPIAWVALNALVFLVLLIVGLVYYDRRYKRKPNPEDERQPSPGFYSTSEVFIDPRDNIRYRVYYNSRTGEREYIRED